MDTTSKQFPTKSMRTSDRDLSVLRGISEPDPALKSIKPDKPQDLTKHQVGWLSGWMLVAEVVRCCIVHFVTVLHELNNELLAKLGQHSHHFQKGFSAKLEKYRPSALLQTFSKILATFLKCRLVDGLDPGLSETVPLVTRNRRHQRLYSKKPPGLGRTTRNNHIADIAGFGNNVSTRLVNAACDKPQWIVIS